MFTRVEARFALRAFLVGVASMATALLAQLPLDGNDVWQALLGGILAALSYAGVGAVVPQVEPNVGTKMKGR